MNSDTLLIQEYFLSDEAATVAMGTDLANIVKSELKQGLIVYLYGDLGAGKTTLTRGFVQSMGHEGHVKSPTYTLVEPYDMGDWKIYHFDLYRLSDPEELEYMGIRDYFSDKSCCFIEWPDKGRGMLADADISIELKYVSDQRSIILTAHNELGKKVLSCLTEKRVVE